MVTAAGLRTGLGSSHGTSSHDNDGCGTAVGSCEGIMAAVVNALRRGRRTFLTCLRGALFALKSLVLFPFSLPFPDTSTTTTSSSSSSNIKAPVKSASGEKASFGRISDGSATLSTSDSDGSLEQEDDYDDMVMESIPAAFRPVPNRDIHEKWMREAINMAELALRSDETPVGCVFVHQGKIIGRGINGTNASLNGTRHAEFVALAEIMAHHPPEILQETDLYVTVEPCIMCASALRQFQIRAVYFGCLNDRFGGCGGVMTVHEDEGVDKGFPAYGGIFREEAIMLLRRFYVQENEKAPDPKPKKNRELKTEILPVNVSRSTGWTPAATPNGAGTPIAGTPSG